MSLTVKVKSASKLPNIERIGKSDPFVVLKFRDLKKETKVIDNELDPVWNEEFQWSLQAPLGGSEVLTIEVYDKETIGKDRLLGSAEFQLRALWKEKHLVLPALKLKPSKKAGKHDSATISLEFLHVSLSDRKTGGHEVAAVAAAGGTADPVGEEQESGDAGDALDTGGLVMNSGDIHTVGGGGEMGGGGGRGVARRRQKRIQLPDKEMEFQIHVHIIECRKLEGNNISPMVKVSCGSQFKKTSSRKGTNRPVFDDTLVFKFKQRPVELFDRKIELKILNTERALREATIGAFMMDVGTVYYEPDHSILQKWLLLIDPDDHAGEAKGFLKASISVLGPNDDPVDLPSTVSADDVDIEANLLRPSGARLQPATQLVKVYGAEDLPQMDPEYFQKFKSLLNIGESQKELVDPYVVVSFAGHQGTTEVKWNTQHPNWKEQINLGFRFPSICDRIRLQLKDKDKYNSDDYICTSYINVPEISAPGEDGFLPTFGPAYINMYGSPREYSDFSDKYEHLNIGKLDGVAYRGRILVEVETVLGSLPDVKKEPISATECRKLQVFQKRRKYRLFAIFMAASMIHPGKKQVEFEVSIGNYGNKLETTIVKQPSTTKPEGPVYDGNSQYFLDWGRNKPCLMVDSNWEDCQYRIETLNYLLSIKDCLSDGLNDIRRKLRLPKAARDNLDENLRELCNQLIGQLIDELPHLPKEGYTRLDKHLRAHRQRELASLCPKLDTIIAVSAPLEEKLTMLDGVLEQLSALAVEPQNSVPDVIVWMLSGNKRVAQYRIPSHQLMYSSRSSKFCGKHCGRQLSLLLKPPAAKTQRELEDNQNEALVQMMFWLGFEGDAASCCKAETEADIARRFTDDSVDTSHDLLSSGNDHSPGGEIVTYAETYENETFLGIWTYIGKKLQRPHWSDAAGKVKQKKEYFDPPPNGWIWDGDWVVTPEHSAADDGVSVYTVEVYEVQTRELGDAWPSSSRWGDNNGVIIMNYDSEGKEQELTKDDIGVPPGWKWMSDDWIVDLQTAGTDDGWSYNTERYDSDEGFPEGQDWIPYERNTDLTRRRRWSRTRQKLPRTSTVSLLEKDLTEGGWEYSHHPGSVYHTNRNTFDFFRRRRWRRKLTALDFGEPCVFYFKDKKSRERKDSATDLYDDPNVKYQTPRMYLSFPRQSYSVYELRAHLYQARSIYGSDSNGLSDAFVVVSCGQQSVKSRVMPQSLSPRWSETLVIGSIKIYGNPEAVAHAPPAVVVKFYDKDTIGQSEYLGRIVLQPYVRMSPRCEDAVLEWFEIERYSKPAGELLAAFELIRIDDFGGFKPPELHRSTAGTYYEIPHDILPVMRKKRIEVLCWGVRDVKRLLTLPVKHPYVEIEVGGVKKETGIVENPAKNPLFSDPFILTLDVPMPVDEVYSPPLNIKVYDKRVFGHTPLVGSYVIDSLRQYEEEAASPTSGLNQLARALTMRHKVNVRDPASADSGVSVEPQSTIIDMSISTDKMKETFDNEIETKYDWWSKYYASVGEESRVQDGYREEGHDKLAVYNSPLEELFGDFADFVHTFGLFRGKGAQKPDQSVGRAVGYFKGAFKVYDIEDQIIPETPKLLSALPIKWPQEVVVRVYVIRGFDLTARDIGGKSDPYICVKIGKREVNNKKDYIPNELNPVFGTMFELKAVLPFDRKMTVTIMDHDLLSADDLIGSTDIDLENRFLSLHRAHIGLAENFHKRGVNRWRDHLLPSDMLSNMCKLQNIPGPVWTSNTVVTFKGREYTLDNFERGKTLPTDCLGEEKERLALYVLRLQGLVPEHIEKRPLYNPVQPGVPQGHLHMWVDLFPKIPGAVIPPPLDICPRKPEKYVLRIVVWNTSDVLLDERCIATGESMSDIYVKGWLTGSDDIQQTDTHYRCMDGDGMFNWRLVYPFEYLVTEKKMVTHVKEHFYSLDKTERRLPVRFNLQVWDNDLISSDDFLGKVEFDLHNMPKLAKRKSQCRLRQLDEEGRYKQRFNLFEQKHARGWMPVYQEGPRIENREYRDNRTLTGKVEIEMEILPETEEKLKPAGKARDDPNMNPFLEKPNRPATSFAWFASPFKTFKHIVWKHHKCKVIFGTILVFFLLSFLMLF